jgi:hypothetical protein
MRRVAAEPKGEIIFSELGDGCSTSGDALSAFEGVQTGFEANAVADRTGTSANLGRRRHRARLPVTCTILRPVDLPR